VTQKATTKKPAKKQIDAVRAELLKDHPDEINRAWYVRRAFDSVEQELWPSIAQAIAGEAPEGLTRHWLSTIGGVGDRTASAHAIAEHATGVNGGRAFITELLTGAAPFVVDDALLLRAIENLQIGRPFAPLFLERGIAIAKAQQSQFANLLAERAAFIARHAAVLADLQPTAQEKKQKAAVAGLARLQGPDRTAMVSWILTEPDIGREARRWARIAGFADPGVEFQTIAFALNDGGGIGDDEEKELAKITNAGGPSVLDRATDMVVYAIERDLINAMEHLAEAAPKAFGTPRGFAAVESALRGNSYTATRICNDMRVLSAVGKAFDDAQAQQLVDILLTCDPSKLEHELGRAFFYLYHPGAVPALARAFEREHTKYFYKCLLDCTSYAGSDAARDLLIDQMWNPKAYVRDLVFALSQSVVRARDAQLLAELERRPSIHAAWVAVGPQVHWNHRPRAVLDIAERVLGWGSLPDADPRKLANIYDHAVDSALELHRYDLGLRCLQALEALGEVVPLDPTDPSSTKKRISGDKAKLAARLASGELAAEAAALRAEIDQARAANAPVRADDERIGRLAGCKVHARFHDDAQTGEVWFVDAEGEYGYYDGFDIAKLDWWRCQPDAAYSGTCSALKDFAAGWRVEERALSIHPGAYREITRSGHKLFVKVWRSDAPPISQTSFAMTCESVERAREIVASFARTPFKGAKLADPFYVTGKRDGGAVVRTVHGYASEKRLLWKLGREVYDSEYKWQSTGLTMCATDEEATAAFDAIENTAMARGCFLWNLELEADLRPLSETPLASWIGDRLRDDNQPASWHLAALADVREALALSGLGADLEIELAGPASEGDLAAYEATLPTPMPDELREMWRGHASAGWKLGKDGARVLSPSEVMSSRKLHRDKLRATIKKIAPKRLTEFPFDHVDVLAVDRDGHPMLAFDQRQEREDCYADVSPANIKRADWWSSLPWMIAVGPSGGFQKLLVAKYPLLKKLLYGQPAAPAKPAAKSAKPVKPKPAAAKKKSAKSKK
jgi:hypothetical protein